jgi:hypothetical protein
VRMLRLFKLVRILRASRLFQRYEAHLGITYAMLHLVKMANLVVLTTHWLACLWVLVGRIDPADDGSKPQGLLRATGSFMELLSSSPSRASLQLIRVPSAPPPRANTILRR